MPAVNIPPKVRFALYLAAVLGGVFVQYGIDRTWFGDAEFRLWTGIATVLLAIAAAKTQLSEATATVTGTVVSETGETGAIAATVEAGGDDTQPRPLVGTRPQAAPTEFRHPDA